MDSMTRRQLMKRLSKITQDSFNRSRSAITSNEKQLFENIAFLAKAIRYIERSKGGVGIDDQIQLN